MANYTGSVVETRRAWGVSHFSDMIEKKVGGTQLNLTLHGPPIDPASSSE